MASRMDRYYKTDVITSRRTQKNRDLYETIYKDDATYDKYQDSDINIDDKTNRIDVNKLNEILNENKQKKRTSIEDEYRKLDIQSVDDDKNYDIRDIMKKAKEQKEPADDIAKNTQYNILKNLKLQDDVDITNVIESYNKKTLENDTMDLFDNLKSDNNTMVGNGESISNIIDEARKEEELEKTKEMDETFFTSSLSFSKNDFEELKDMHSSIKTNNILIKVVLVILGILIISAIVFIMFKFVF